MPSDDATPSQHTVWSQLLRWSGNRNRDELLTDIGLGKKIASMVAKRLARLLTERGVRPDAVTLTMGRYGADDSSPTQGMVMIDGSEGLSVQLARCCRPVPGDEILGYLGRGEGLLIHTADCSTGKRLFARDSEGWLSVGWAEQPTRAFETAISLLLQNGKGVLAEVATAVAEAEADITHIEMGDQAVSETGELKLLLAVRDRLHLDEVMRSLKRLPAVLRVGRFKP